MCNFLAFFHLEQLTLHLYLLPHIALLRYIFRLSTCWYVVVLGFKQKHLSFVNLASVGKRKGRFNFYLYRAHKEWVVGSVLNSLWGFLQWNLSCLGFLSPFVPRFQSSETQSGGVGRERKEVLSWFMLWHPILRHVALPVCPLAVQIFGQKRVVRQSMKDDDRKTTY